MAADESKTRAMTITTTFSIVEVNHILALFRDAEEDGSYYGPKAQYWKRHNRIIKKLALMLEMYRGKM